MERAFNTLENAQKKTLGLRAGCVFFFAFFFFFDAVQADEAVFPVPDAGGWVKLESFERKTEKTVEQAAAPPAQAQDGVPAFAFPAFALPLLPDRTSPSSPPLEQETAAISDEWKDLGSFERDAAALRPRQEHVQAIPQETPSLPEDKTTLAQPTRLLDLPSAPGLRPVSSLAGASREEENAAFLRDGQEWKDIEAFEREAKSDEEFGGEANPLNIRFAVMPDLRDRPVPGQNVSKSVGERRAAQEAKKTKSPRAKEEASPEACQTLVDMRRRQLEAIESDRKTLSALRAALTDLGLTERLSFMESGEGATAGRPTETSPVGVEAKTK